jgi:GDSL-like Lipase/Acylhydrolase family
MSFLENRYYWHTEKKSPDVYRIVCLGDSLTYGVGVQPQESLPAQLEALLNRNVWEPIIEVVNAGISGFSLYDDWYFFLNEIHKFQPDLLLFVLCENDVELTSNEENYQDHVKACWDEQGQYLRYFKKAVAQIGEHVRALNLQCLVTFYSISGEEEKGEYALILKNICSETGLDFVNLAEEFTEEFSGKLNPAMNASSVDHHPSRLAHQVAAQRLSRHISRKKLITKNNAFSSEKELCGKVFLFGEFLRENGVQPEICIYRMLEMLNAKRTGKARNLLDPEILIDDKDFAQKRSVLSKEMEHGYKLVFLEGLAERFKRNSTMFYRWIENSQRSTIDIEKHSFILEENLRDPSLSYCPSCKYEEEYDFSTFPSRLAMLSEKLNQISSNFLIPLHRLGGIPAELLPLQEDLVRKIEAPSAFIQSFIEILRDKLKNADALFDRFCKMFRESKEQLSNLTISRYFALISQKLMVHLMELEAAYSELKLNEINPLLFQQNLAPFTTISVTIRSSNAKIPNIIVIAESVIPFRHPLRGFQYVVNDGQSHVYSFAFPLFTLGRVSVHLLRNEETFIEGIAVFNNESNIIQYGNLSKEPEFSLPITLIPI